MRITRFAHKKATQLTEDPGTNLTTIYMLAIDHAYNQLPQIPEMHLATCQGELAGTTGIRPWIPEDSLAKFNAIAKGYRNNTLAISAIVNDYCDFVANASFE